MTDATTVVGSNVFNARDLKSREVAQSFIAPAAFSTLLGNFHCVLEGPRGSGKTTLLRMLTPEAFARWSSVHGGASINFIGIFVPADVRWSKQLEARLSGLDSGAKQLFMESAFSVATSLALVETIECCSSNAEQFASKFPELFFPIDRAKEAEIVRVLSELWQLTAQVPSFSGIKLALRVRQHEVGLLAALASCGSSTEEIVRKSPFIASSWLDNVTTSIESVNQLIGRPEQRWAILLDELEIVPSEILNRVVQSLRSTSALIKLKLALSPAGTDLVSSGDSTAPTPENDYLPIPLWYDSRKEARSFAERLLESAIQRDVAGEGKGFAQVLGISWIGETEDDDDVLKRVQLSDSAKRQRIEAFVSLYGKDASFQKLLDNRKIDPREPPLLDNSENGTFVRKITPLVCMRDREIGRYLSAAQNRKKGGRKSSDPYVGYPNILDLMEGNPRWVLTLAGFLHAQSKLQAQPLRSQGVQSAAIRDYTDQFVSKLKVYPTGRATGGTPWSLMKFVSYLGDALNESLYRADFKGDPALSFTLDARALGSYETYIRLCIDLGALVLMRGSAAAPLVVSPGESSLIGARVRLSYRLAPVFRLPFRATKVRAMSGAIRAGTLLDGAAVDANVQAELSDAGSTAKLLQVQPRLL